MKTFLSLAILLSCMAAFTSCAHRPHDKSGEVDPYLWLEQVESPESLLWVKAQNDKTLPVFEKDPSYAGIERSVRKILLAKDRIPMPAYRGGFVYNFWQDEKSVRGLWRRTTLAEYGKKNPKWDVLLDFDKLAAAERENWVYKGANCLAPQYERCLLRLSRGGKDASVHREFDIVSRQFVAGGFTLPEAKSGITWVKRDEVLVATDFGADSLTLAGYPRIMKLWKRGQPLNKAVQVFEVPKTDDEVDAETFFTTEQSLTLILRRKTFFEEEAWVFDRAKQTTRRLQMPDDATVTGFYRSRVLVRLRSEWKSGKNVFSAGALVALSPNEEPAQEPSLIYAPDSRSAIRGVAVSRHAVYVSILENVKGRVLRIIEVPGVTGSGQLSWQIQREPLPDNGVVDVVSADPFTDVALTSFESFLMPTTLMHGTKILKQLPRRFDASRLAMTQYEATSADGTKVPYFVVHRKDMKFKADNPTLLYAYGGFEIAVTPGYAAVTGKVWLEKGGVYALANIRGGGEFGPRWHQAALKTNRQRAFDDFIAVAEDMVARKITSPRRLGIMGGSNGGLLMGAAFTQRPDLFSAVVCKVPLLDMLRYNQLLAGASWMGEYGDPGDPEMRRAILKYSPYQKIDLGLAGEKRYPEVFFETSTKDDRVHPGHARKMVAKMQALGHPIYYFENMEGGHGAAANLNQKIHMTALDYTYLSKKLGVH